MVLQVQSLVLELALKPLFKMKRILIVYCLFSLCITSIIAQEYTYDIKVWGRKIGKAVTQKKIDGEYTIYTTTSKSEVRFFGKKTIISYVRTVFKNDTLQSSFYKVTKNKKIKEEATISLKNGVYTVVTNGKKTVYKSPVLFSTIMLTYTMPNDQQKVFEEVGGFDKTMKKIKERHFKLINPESRHKDEYFYTPKGILQKCVIKHTLANIVMELQPQKKLQAKHN